MNRALSNLGIALILALAILAATGLVVAAPHGSWIAAAGPLLLVLALLGVDLAQHRRARPSPTALVLSAAILLACGMVAVDDLDQLAVLIPILGSTIVIPVLLRREGARPSCRRA